MVFNMKDVSLRKDGTWILKGVTWNVKEGEHWALFGLNGSGKTALLNMLNAYEYPSKGDMVVLGRKFGKNPLGEHLRKRIGLVSSSLQQKFYQGDSAYEIVLSGAFASIGLYETPTDEIRVKAVQFLKQLGCLDYADRSYESLSQGEKQRVLIARALMADPELLILDEPTNGLDFIARETLLEVIDTIAKTKLGPTIIYVTHHVEEILPSFTKTLLLRKGKVFGLGETKEMLTSEKLSAFFEIGVNVSWIDNRPILSRSAIRA